MKMLGCRAEMMKKLSWTYGLGFGVVLILILCVYSLFTISRAAITTVTLDNADQLKEVKSCYVAVHMILQNQYFKTSQHAVRRKRTRCFMRSGGWAELINLLICM